ncbi:Translocation protein S66 [Umbelopsis sp. WA50703]
MATSLLLPASYLGGCIAAMSAFSYVYRRATATSEVEPWFGPNIEKEQYIALLNSTTTVPEHHMRAALLRRAVAGVKRLVHIQQEKPPLQQLLRTGSVGDDLWREFNIAEQETMAELQEIVGEANSYKEGWGQTIFTTAAQMVEHEKQKVILDEMKTRKEEEERLAKLNAEREERDGKDRQEREAEKREREAQRAAEELLKQEEVEKKSKSKK